jgi:hypothetical protein
MTSIATGRTTLRRAAVSLFLLVWVGATAGPPWAAGQESYLSGNSTAVDGSQQHWSVAAGSVFLHRSPARPGSLVFYKATTEELANVHDFDLGWAAGPQLELSRHFDGGWDVAVRYFDIDGWKAARSLADPNSLRVPLVSNNPADFFDTASADYTSRLYNTELNLKRRFGDRLSVLAGFRYLELHEQVSAEAWKPGLEGTVNIGTSNYLYGFQTGVESILLQVGRLQIDGDLKAGVYGNNIRGTMHAHGTYLDDDSEGTASHTSFVGEVGLTGRYQFGRHLAVFGGYQVMWLQGVVLAGDYVSSMANPLAHINVLEGAALYHGANTGLELRW